MMFPNGATDLNLLTPNYETEHTGQRIFGTMLRIVPRKYISTSCKWDTWKISKRMVNGDTPHIFKKEFAGQSVLYKIENKISGGST